MRRDYTIALEITPTAAIMHGGGTKGNTSTILRRERVVQVIDKTGTPIGWRRVMVPTVSGAALKATLREQAVYDALERAGIGDGEMSMDALRLLKQGGKNVGSNNSLSLDTIRKMRDLFPLIAVFGAFDSGLPMRGSIVVSDVTPYARELVDAGLVPSSVRPVTVGDGAEPEGPSIDIFPDTLPIPLSMTTSEETHYRHDLRNGPAVRLLATEERAAMEDLTMALKGKSATKEERGTANESMPHTAEVICAGVPMVATIRLRSATEAEFGCLAVALGRWVALGAHLGGGSRTGHGACTVRVAGSIRHDPEEGSAAMAPGTALDLHGDPSEVAAARTYAAHVGERREQIREYLGAM